MSSTHRWAVAVASALALAAPVYAQQDAPIDAGQSLLTSSLLASPPLIYSLFAPTLGSSQLGLQSAYAEVGAPVVQSSRSGRDQDVVMMIVGGAALVVGAVIDGDAGTIIMIGGGAVGLLGLYRYLS